MPDPTESLLEKYGGQEIRFLGVITVKNGLDETVKRIITLKTKNGEIISEHEGRDIENIDDLDDTLIHLIDRMWLSEPWLLK